MINTHGQMQGDVFLKAYLKCINNLVFYYRTGIMEMDKYMWGNSYNKNNSKFKDTKLLRFPDLLS